MIKKFRVRAFVFAICFLISMSGKAGPGNGNNSLTVASPDGKLKVVFSGSGSGRLKYELLKNALAVIEPSDLGITVDGVDSGNGAQLPDTMEISSHKETLYMIGNHRTAENNYNQVIIPLKSADPECKLQVRVFNDGMAFRYLLSGDKPVTVSGETSSFKIPAGSIAFLQTNTLNYEGVWHSQPVDQVQGKVGMPITFKLPQAVGYVLVSEAAVYNYSGMTLQSSRDSVFRAVFEDDKTWRVSPAQDGMIKTPWRVIVATDDLNGLVNSDIIFSLNPPPDPALFADGPEWIKPGRALWPWWSEGTGMPSLNRKYIDAANRMGFEYILVDEGWEFWGLLGLGKWKELAKLVDYGRKQNVGVWVWKRWGKLADPEYRDKFFEQVKKAGADGVKIDFMDNESQSRINFYEAAMKDAARHKLMVNFHGANKPTGESRTYPNEMTREGLRGLEYNKGVATLPASHNAIMPFTRNVAGPMDYTVVTFEPIKLGETSFAHQLATAVVFLSYVANYADRPENYLDNPAAKPALDVLVSIPAVWDETVVLPASVLGECAAFARRSKDKWFVGVLNAKGAGDIRINLGFLAKGKYQAIILADDPSKKAAFQRSEKIVQAGDKIESMMRNAGGLVVMLTPVP